MKRDRLDKLVFERGLVESIDSARRYIMAGQVRVGGVRMDKPGTAVEIGAQLEVIERQRFVSRGGTKLAGALQKTDLAVRGLICADVGASTGGFASASAAVSGGFCCECGLRCDAGLSVGIAWARGKC